MSEVRQRLENDLTAIRTAIDAGQLDEANVMLAAASLNASPGGEFSKEIGDLFLTLGFPVMAGRYWYLLDDKSDEMLAACKEFERSLGNNPVWISHIAWSANNASPQVNARLQELREKARDFRRKHQYDVKAHRGWRDRIALLGCGIVSIILIFVFLMGIAFIVKMF